MEQIGFFIIFVVFCVNGFIVGFASFGKMRGSGLIMSASSYAKKVKLAIIKESV